MNKNVSKKIYLDFNIQNGKVIINNISFHLPSSPLIYQSKKINNNMFCNVNDRQSACTGNSSKHCSCIHKYDIKLNDVVELILFDGGTHGESHPAHLHGQSFSVLGMDKVFKFIINV